MSEAVKKIWHSKELVKPEGKDLDRFWSYLTKEGPLPDQTNPFYKGLGPCWAWIGPKSTHGYGSIAINRRPKLAHRMSYAVAHGRTPAGVMILHKCDNKLCVNPEHLAVGDAWDNMADRDRKGRQASGDRNGSRTKPENLRRGENHPKRLRPEETPRGEEHGRARVTEAQVIEMRRRFDAGEVRIFELVRETQLEKSTVRSIVRRKNWKHLP